MTSDTFTTLSGNAIISAKNNEYAKCMAIVYG